MALEKKKVGILAECVCDLPKSTLRSRGIDILYFLVETESGVFTDTDEITAENVISHMEKGGRTKSAPPPPEIYKKAFEKSLKRHDEVILVAISSHISHSCENAEKAVKLMGDDGKRVHIFDSEHLSTGLGFLVLRAAELAAQGCDSAKILSELEAMKPRVSTTFIAKNADYLYRNGLVSAFVKSVCSILSIHPVLTMKNGDIRPKTVILGSYENACRTYIKKELKGKKNIDSRQAFVTHVGCSVKMLRIIKSETKKYCGFNELTVTDASATISSNCGPDTFGILFVRTD
ncbi:MAG: DegV family protein [Oscillospiraceae bacterium]|nr:DegV family protein [Oscillospiraceae bacterium]